MQRLEVMLREGTVACEIKSGYGLDTKTELKMLRAIADASAQSKVHVVLTACIGHAIDPHAPGGRDAFIAHTITETLPAVHAEFPGIAIDAYIEEGAWTLKDGIRLFEAALELGHPIRVHTDQFHALGMTEWAIAHGALSVDHLEATGVDGIRAVGASDTFGVALPISGFHTDQRYTDGRGLIDAGAKLIIATNCNPGSAPSSSMPLAIALAVRHCGLTPAEAIRACTTNAAALIRAQDPAFPISGTIEPGNRADLILLRHTDERELAHTLGGNPVDVVIAGGEVVAGDVRGVLTGCRAMSWATLRFADDQHGPVVKDHPDTERRPPRDIPREARSTPRMSAQPKQPIGLNEGYDEEQVAALLDVKAAVIRRWHKQGLARPKSGRYDFSDIVSLREVADLVKAGVKPSVIRKTLDRMAQQRSATGAPAPKVALSPNGSEELVARIDGELLSADGQRFFDFDEQPEAGEDDEPVVGAVVPEQKGPAIIIERKTPAPELLFERALRLEADGQLTEAAQMYRRVIAIAPEWAEAHYNLGNALRAMGKVEAAEELYRLTVALDEDYAAAWYNLGDVLDERGEVEEAVEALQSTLDAEPEFTDAHYNLASCLERLGRHDEAAPHWGGVSRARFGQHVGRCGTEGAESEEIALGA